MSSQGVTSQDTLDFYAGLMAEIKLRFASLDSIMKFAQEKKLPARAAEEFAGAAPEVWAKCDLAMSVSHSRLDRIRLASGEFVTGIVSNVDLRRIYFAVAYGFGIDARGVRG